MLHMHVTTPPQSTAAWKLRTGYALSCLVILFTLMDVAMKLLRLPIVLETTAQLGWPSDSAMPLGVVLLLCTALYALSHIPFTVYSTHVAPALLTLCSHDRQLGKDRPSAHCAAPALNLVQQMPILSGRASPLAADRWKTRTLLLHATKHPQGGARQIVHCA
jgi:hypothetical protein